MWDVRPRSCHDNTTNTTTTTLKLNNSREVTETVFSSEVCSVRHQRSNANIHITPNCYIKQQQQPTNPPSPTNSMAVVTCGEVVVFDDIGDNWQGLRLDLHDNANTNINVRTQPGGERESPPPPQPPLSPATYHNDFLKVTSELTGSPEPPQPNIAQMIGNLPIAVYEGSPRRYGPRQSETHPTLPSAHSLLASPSVYPPRPGFPQRVISIPSENEENASTPVDTQIDHHPHPVNSTFDYLYEFSETRKVLEEFFKCPPDGDNPLLAVAEENAFQDLDYELHRQAGQLNDPASGSSYVGQRLAKTRLEQENLARMVDGSPRKPNEFSRIQVCTELHSSVQ